MKSIKLIFLSLFAMTIAIGLSSCAHDHSDHSGDHSAGNEGHDHGATSPDAGDAHDDHAEGEIHLSPEQIKTIGLKTGDFSQIKINDYVKATGTLGIPPNGYSSVSARADGFIRNSRKYVEGSYVKKGAAIAYLENPAFIERQQAYLEILAELSYLKKDLNRQQSLVDANAGPSKPLEKAQAAYAQKEAQKKGTEKYLSYLGFNLERLAGGDLRQQIAITAPISGYITTVNLHNGLFVKPDLELLEIVDDKHLHLELNVFEKDIAKIKVGHKISYFIPALGAKSYQGSVYVIGKEFDGEHKTIRVHGHLEGDRPPFIKDLYVEGRIWLNDQTVDALPEKAVIKDGASYYVYAMHKEKEGDEHVFEKFMVIPGGSANGFTSVKLVDVLPEDMKVVTEGAYYVYAQSKAGELKHEH